MSVLQHANDLRPQAQRKRATLAPTLFMMAIALMVMSDAQAQSGHLPQPAPRPRETREAPARQPDSNAPIKASPTAEPPAPQSRQEWRSLQRACAQEWSRRKMAGRTTGLIWVDFFEMCRRGL